MGDRWTRLARHGAAVVLVAAVAIGLALAEGRSVVAQGLFGMFRDRAPDAAADPRRALSAAYPNAFRIEGGAVVFPDGTRIVWDDGRAKSAEALLTEADVEDMFAYPYPRASAGALAPARDADPGRVRNEAFFRALYGGSEAAVRREVTRVSWIGGKAMTVTTRFGVDRALARVRDTLARRPDLSQFLTPPAGGFLWRNIAGTGRLSVHSFGAAVDINTAFTDYWMWDKPSGGTLPYRNRIPLDVVAAFEANCFIWGGRWYHYDTMHFEYRPELLPGCRRGSE